MDPAPRRPWVRWVLIGILALALAAFVLVRALFTVPDDLDLATQKPSDAGLYLITLASNDPDAGVGPIHQWTITVTTQNGVPIDGAVVAIGGGMPQHGHGMPTSPQVTDALGNGGYLVEGMKFSMGGWWTLTVTIDGPTGRDEATFNIVL